MFSKLIFYSSYCFLRSSAPVAKAAWSIAETIKSELRNVLPAIGHASSAEQVFSALAGRADPTVVPLLTFALSLLLADHTSPPTAGLISKVRSYVLHLQASSDELIAADSAAQATDGTAERVFSDITDPACFKLLLQLVGGVATAEIERSLPRIVDVLAEDADALRMVFSRMTKARPAPLTKSALVVTLHRCATLSHPIMFIGYFSMRKTSLICHLMPIVLLFDF